MFNNMPRFVNWIIKQDTMPHSLIVISEAANQLVNLLGNKFLHFLVLKTPKDGEPLGVYPFFELVCAIQDENLDSFML